MLSPPSEMKILLVLVKIFWKTEIELLPSAIFTWKLEFVTNILWMNVGSECGKGNTLRLLLVCVGEEIFVVVLFNMQMNSLAEDFQTFSKLWPTTFIKWNLKTSRITPEALKEQVLLRAPKDSTQTHLN